MDGKVDFVIPFTLDAKQCYSHANTGYEHLELEYVIRSIRKFCPWSGRIFVVGPKDSSIFPEYMRGEVICIPCGDPYTHIKDANIINKIKTAIESVPDLSETFIKASDDQIVTKPCSISDFYPRIKYDMTGHLKEYESMMGTYSNADGSKTWNMAMLNTLKKFPRRAFFYEPHIWSPMNKHKFMEMCRTFDIENDTGIVIMSLYYNFVNHPPRGDYDHTYMHAGLDERQIKAIITSPTRHVAWVDKIFSYKLFREFLGKLLDLER